MEKPYLWNYGKEIGIKIFQSLNKSTGNNRVYNKKTNQDSEGNFMSFTITHNHTEKNYLLTFLSNKIPDEVTLTVGNGSNSKKLVHRDIKIESIDKHIEFLNLLNDMIEEFNN